MIQSKTPYPWLTFGSSPLTSFSVQFELASNKDSSSEHVLDLQAQLVDSMQLADTLQQMNISVAAAAAAAKQAEMKVEADRTNAKLVVVQEQLALQVKYLLYLFFADNNDLKSIVNWHLGICLTFA